MTPEETGRALAAEMRMHAKTRRSQAADYARDAEDYQTKANVARREAARLTAMADAYDRAAEAQLPVFGAPEVLSSTPLATAFGDAPAGVWDDPADEQPVDVFGRCAVHHTPLKNGVCHFNEDDQHPEKDEAVEDDLATLDPEIASAVRSMRIIEAADAKRGAES